jgi:hypothetical protein
VSLLAERENTDAEMAADWAAIQEKFAEPEAPEVDEAPETEVVETLDTKVDERARDESGKFAKAPKEAKAPVEKATPAPKEAAPVVADSSEPAPQAAPARDITRAPSSWKPAIREEWGKLSENVRAEIQRREQDYQNGQAQLLPDATMGKQMRAVIEPYRMLIDAEGSTPDRAVADLLRTAATLRIGSQQEKLNALLGVVRDYGIDLPALVQQRMQQAGNPQAPQAQQAQQFRDPRVDQMLREQAQERQQREQQYQTEMGTTVTAWMDAVDASSGQPVRPYIGDVINEMSVLVAQLKQSNPSLTHVQALDEAYERAIWANPEIRQVLQSKQQTEREQQLRSANQTRVADARRAASVNVPRRASTPAPGKPGRLEDTINETARALGLIE